MCCKDDKIKIIDFGTAKKLDADKAEKAMCGTAEFLAPEIVNYDDISTQTDMWAVGVICYILLSGYSPFLGDNDGQTFNNISGCLYDFNIPEFQHISESAKDFVSKLLVKEQGERLTATKV